MPILIQQSYTGRYTPDGPNSLSMIERSRKFVCNRGPTDTKSVANAGILLIISEISEEGECCSKSSLDKLKRSI